MKTTTRTNPKAYHVGLRLDGEAMLILDNLCAELGGASHSRVLRRLLFWLQSMPSERYQSYDGTPIEENHHRREFVEHFRRMDDAMIQDMVKGITEAVRRK